MNHWGIAAVLALSAMGGCSDSSPAFDSEAVVALQECADDAYLDFVSVGFYVSDIVEATRSFTPPPPQVAGVPLQQDITVSPTGTPNEFDFDFAVDVDGDTTNDTTVSGRILFSDDPVDASVVGETATVTLSRATSGSVTGIDADLALSFVSGQEIDISGRVTSSIDGCTIVFDAASAAPVRMTFARNFSDARLAGVTPDTSAFATLGFGLDGTLQVQLTDGVTTVDTTASVTADQFGVSFSDSVVDGVDVPNPDAVLLPTDAELESLVRCQAGGIFMVTALLQTLDDGPSEGETLTFTPVANGAPLEYDFEYAASGGTIRGRAVFPNDPEGEAPLVGDVVFSSWSVETDAEPQLAGISFPLDMTVTSENGFVLTFDGDGPNTMSGQFTATDGVCTVALALESTFVLDDGGGGTIILDIAVGGHTMDVIVAAGEQTGWQISVNGIALPQTVARFLLALA